MERIQKVIAASGAASRRKAEELIKAGKVTVNGLPASIGMQVSPDARIVVDGTVLHKAQHVTYLLNKPVGVICSTKKQAAEKIVTELVPSVPAVYPVGRLDKESGGLILLTNDGELAQKLAHPSFGHSKKYRVAAKWKPDSRQLEPEKIRKLLLTGVKLGDGKASADDVTILSSKDSLLLTITIHEGRHHLVRRMCASVGLTVTSLIRVQLAHFIIGKLPIGGYRVLTASEISALLATHAS